jgi:hypothetical protein
MIIIQAIVILAAISVILMALNSRRTHVGRAWKKICLCLLAIGMVVAVLFPNTTNDLAHFVGVGRGADLLLYCLVLAFIVYVLGNYLHQQDEKDAMYRLARRIALLEAEERYNIRRRDRT